MAIKRVITARGISMFPTLKSGQKLQVYKKKPRTGDIIVFFNKQKLICHRYINVLGKEWTRGDNNYSFDEFPIKKYVGVVKLKENRLPIILKLYWQLFKRVSKIIFTGKVFRTQ